MGILDQLSNVLPDGNNEKDTGNQQDGGNDPTGAPGGVVGGRDFKESENDPRGAPFGVPEESKEAQKRFTEAAKETFSPIKPTPEEEVTEQDQGFSRFQKQARNTGRDISQGIAREVTSLGITASEVSDVIQDKPGLETTLQGVPGMGSAISITTQVNDLVNKTIKNDTRKDDITYTPDSEFEKALFGDQKIGSYEQEVGKPIRQLGQKAFGKKVESGDRPVLDYTIAGAIGALDFATPGLPAGSLLSKAARSARSLKYVDDIVNSKAVKKATPKLSHADRKKLGDELVDVNDEETASRVITKHNLGKVLDEKGVNSTRKSSILNNYTNVITQASKRAKSKRQLKKSLENGINDFERALKQPGQEVIDQFNFNLGLKGLKSTRGEFKRAFKNAKKSSNETLANAANELEAQLQRSGQTIDDIYNGVQKRAGINPDKPVISPFESANTGVIEGNKSLTDGAVWSTPDKKSFKPNGILSDVKMQEIVKKSLDEVPASKNAKEELGKGLSGVELGTIQRDPDAVKNFLNGKNWLQRTWLRFREIMENSQLRAEKFLENPHLRVDENAITPTQAQDLYKSKINTALEDLKYETDRIGDTIRNTAKGHNLSEEEFRKEVKEYLQAQHAPDFNAVHGDGAAGLTNKEAEDIIDEKIDSGMIDDIEKVGERLKRINRETIKLARDSEIISKEVYETLVNKYPNHVPLHRVFDESGEQVSDVGEIFGSPIKRAKGSDREVRDVFQNIIENSVSVRFASEKNLVAKSWAKFVRENPELKDMRIRGKKVTKKTEVDSLKQVDVFENIQGENVIPFWENGKRKVIEVDDKRLASIMNDANKVFNLGNHPAMKGIMNFSRGFANLVRKTTTQYNPGFWLSNNIRDLQEMLLDMQSRKEFGISGAVSASNKHLKSMRGIVDDLFGEGNSVEAQYYREAREVGGMIGGVGADFRNQLTDEIHNLSKRNVNLGAVKDIAKVTKQGKQTAQDVLESLDKMNKIFEDSARLDVFIEARKSGLSKQRAGLMSKEASVNFDRMGEIGPLLNSFFPFFNASVQGTSKFIRSASRNKTNMTLIAAGIIGGTQVINSWNDAIDPKWRQRTSEHDREKNLMAMIPNKDGDPKPLTIPLGWSVVPMKSVGDTIYDMRTGYVRDAGNAVGRIASSVIDVYNPLGGDDVFSALMPGIGDIPLDISQNETWSGMKIHQSPKFTQNAEESERYWNSLTENEMGKLAIKGTSWLSDKTGIEISPADATYAIKQLSGGIGQETSNLINTIENVAEGKKTELREAPILNRFFGLYDETGKRIKGKEMSDDIKSLLEAQGNQSIQESRIENKIIGKYEDTKSKAKREELLRLTRDKYGTDFYQRVIDEIRVRDAELTDEERGILQLHKNNGTRAAAVHTKIKHWENEGFSKQEIEDKLRRWSKEAVGIYDEDIKKQLEKIRKELENRR